jgi:hypothetical protein
MLSIIFSQTKMYAAMYAQEVMLIPGFPIEIEKSSFIDSQNKFILTFQKNTNKILDQYFLFNQNENKDIPIAFAIILPENTPNIERSVIKEYFRKENTQFQLLFTGYCNRIFLDHFLMSKVNETQNQIFFDGTSENIMVYKNAIDNKKKLEEYITLENSENNFKKDKFLDLITLLLSKNGVIPSENLLNKLVNQFKQKLKENQKEIYLNFDHQNEYFALKGEFIINESQIKELLFKKGELKKEILDILKNIDPHSNEIIFVGDEFNPKGELGFIHSKEEQKFHFSQFSNEEYIHYLMDMSMVKLLDKIEKKRTENLKQEIVQKKSKNQLFLNSENRENEVLLSLWEEIQSLKTDDTIDHPTDTFEGNEPIPAIPQAASSVRTKSQKNPFFNTFFDVTTWLGSHPFPCFLGNIAGEENIGYYRILPEELDQELHWEKFEQLMEQESMLLGEPAELDKIDKIGLFYRISWKNKTDLGTFLKKSRIKEKKNAEELRVQDLKFIMALWQQLVAFPYLISNIQNQHVYIAETRSSLDSIKVFLIGLQPNDNHNNPEDLHLWMSSLLGDELYASIRRRLNT